MVDAEVYPDPGARIVHEVGTLIASTSSTLMYERSFSVWETLNTSSTLNPASPSNTAVAVAPDPAPPVKVTVGADE